jgi:hypothetical protein
MDVIFPPYDVCQQVEYGNKNTIHFNDKKLNSYCFSEAAVMLGANSTGGLMLSLVFNAGYHQGEYLNPPPPPVPYHKKLNSYCFSEAAVMLGANSTGGLMLSLVFNAGYHQGEYLNPPPPDQGEMEWGGGERQDTEGRGVYTGSGESWSLYAWKLFEY